MGTTTITTIREASEAEAKLFANTMIADKKIDAECAMFNEFSYYKSCSQHHTKLTENGHCKVCGEVEKDDGKLDFRSTLLLVTNDETIIPITVGKICQIDYNENGDDDNVAIKVKIL